MKNILLPMIAIFFSNTVFAQVGIGTTTPNSTLTVEGSLETGFKEVTASYALTSQDYNVSYVGSAAATITLPAVQSGSLSFSGRTYKIKNLSPVAITLAGNGTDKIRNIDTIGSSTFIIPAGHFIEIVNNTNVSGGGTWDLSYIGYPAPATLTYTLGDIYDYTATAPQLVNANGKTPLTGFSQSITIPANKTAKIIISYSIPAGANVGISPAGYYGITMLKNGSEVQAGSRKSTQIPNPPNAGASITAINGSFSDNIPASGTDQTITYSLSAYLEGSNFPISFGMASATGNNFNWGYGYWSLTVFYK